MTSELNYSTAPLKELLKRYNEKARDLGEPEMARAPSRVKMVEALALIQTRRKPKDAEPDPAEEPAPQPEKSGRKQKQPIRDAMIFALSEVAYYETPEGRKLTPQTVKRYNKKGLISVGYSYTECAKRVRKKFPKCKVTPNTLRVASTNISAGTPGFEGGNLPNKRPRSTEGV